MRVATLSLMRNEADVIEAFARYHLQFVDGMLFIDHRSNDRSREIVLALQAEGLPVELRCKEVMAYDQVQMTNAHTLEAADIFEADWILPLDLDECLHAPDLVDPIQELREQSGELPLAVPWRTYVPTESDDLQEMNPLKRVRHRCSHETQQFYKAMVPSHLLRYDKRYYLSMGNHRLDAKRKCDRLEPVTAQRTWVGHFPVRSKAQYLSKILVGWLAALASEQRKPTQSAHWKANFDLILDQGDMNLIDLQQRATAYLGEDGGRGLIEDPLPARWLDYELSLTDRISLSPYTNAIKFAEEITQAYVDLQRLQKRRDRRSLKLGPLQITWD